MHVPHRAPIETIDTVVANLPDPPILTTRGRGWIGVTVDVFPSTPAYTLAAAARDHHLIAFCRQGGSRLVQRRLGHTHESLISAGTSIIMPAGVESEWEGITATSARIRLPIHLLQDAAAALGDRHRTEIVNTFETNDPVLASLARLMLVEMAREEHPVQALVFEHLSAAMAAHLVRAYNVHAHPPASRAVKLHPRALERVTEFIETNLNQPFSLERLARIAKVSKFHFARAFKNATGATPMQFVEHFRIERAIALISSTDMALGDIAQLVGFADQSHFTRRFHRQVGDTPAKFARQFNIRRAPRQALE